MATGTLGETLNVLIADSYPLILAGIRRALDRDPQIHVVGEARSSSELLGLVERRRPGVVLMDFPMADGSGTTAIDEIRRSWPNVKIVVLSAADDPGTIGAALQAGASAFIVKNAELSDIGPVLRQTAARTAHHAIGYATVDEPAGVDPRSPGLTDREQVILGLIAKGLTTAVISQDLWVSQQTVKFHLTNIYRKLGVANRAAAVRYAVERGLAPVG
jgi:DNA-binding NarL/FixJ family response regulator